ncbi:MAG: GNAT family N-acetyltransferase [Deltaproteobacteria bacterium]|nr:GNAT family N-acetyltransferase [Deltaproteobacteria bacterium]
MSFEIRPARPEDAEFIAWVMLAAGRSHLSYGVWDHYIGRTEEERLAFLTALSLTAAPHPFHHSIFIVAEEHGNPIAGLCGYDPAFLNMGNYLQSLPEVFEKRRWSKDDQRAAFKRIISFLCCIPANASGAWIIDSVATLPQARRRGIISKLLEHIIAKGRSLGLKRAQINVLIGNIPAWRSYENRGFTFDYEKRNPQFETTYVSPGIARLLRGT